MVYIFICVDFDRDYAIPLKGFKHAISEPLKDKAKQITENPKLSTLIEGSSKSLEPFVSYLNNFKIPAVFYHEARTLKLFNSTFPKQLKALKNPLFEHGVHGYDHEDLTGEETEIILTEKEEEEIINLAKVEIEETLSTKTIGFRAPYMRKTANTIDILSDLGFVYDSSVYVESNQAIKPYRLNENVIEFPVIKTPKDSIMRGMYTYLWPLFEGKRTKDEVISNYQELVKNSEEKESYISINLHSWHFAYNISDKRYLMESEIRANVSMFKDLVNSLAAMDDVNISTPAKWIEENEF